MYAFAFGFGFGRSGGGTLADIFVTPPAAIASASAVAPTVEVTGAPLAPINVTLIAALSDRGASNSDGISNDPTPNYQMDFDAIMAAGDTIHQFLDDVLHDSYVIQAADLIAGLPPGCFGPLPSDDTYSITFKHQNPDGTSPASTPVSYTLNTSLGAATLALAAGGLVTADTTPTVRVVNASAVENDVVEVRRVDDGTILGSKTWDATDATNGYADATLSALSVGEHELMGYVYGTAGGSGAGTFTQEALATLTINAVLAISGTPVLTATEGEAYAGFTASATGGVTPYVFSLVGTWPTGLSIDSGTGVVSGTPTESGSFASLSVRVTDAESNTDDLATFTLEVEAAGYVANAVNSAANTVLNRGAALTGAADGKVGIASFWAKLGDSGQSRTVVCIGGGPACLIRRNNLNKWEFAFKNNANSTVLRMLSASSWNNASGWHHVLAAWDLANGVGQLYINDADDRAASPTIVDDNIDYNPASAQLLNIASPTLIQPYSGDIADVYFNIVATLDLSVEANRRKFIDALGKPVDLGADGSTPTGTAPIIFASGATASWHTNKGSGGGFTVTAGGLTTASTSPSD